MLRSFKCLPGPAFTALAFATVAAAQTQHQPRRHTQHPPPAQSGVATLRAGTQLVVVDVVVTDKNQKPVHGLKASDFTLTEENVPQPSSTSKSTPPSLPPTPREFPPCQ